MSEFGSLDPTDWREQEAQEGLALQQRDAAAKAAQGRTWGDTARSVMNAPYALAKGIGGLASSPSTPASDEAAMMPETFVNPLVKGAADALGSAVASGATAPGEALAGKIPQYGPEGHTSPEMIHRGFDTAALAGGGSVAGTTEALPKLAADSAKAGAPLAAVEHSPEMKAWFGNSRAVNKDGTPTVVYRGEHGAPTDQPFQSRLNSLSFGDQEAANTYAQHPNNYKEAAQAPRVTPAYVKIEKPIVENRDDPFLDLSHLQKELGNEEAMRIAHKFSNGIENTGNWHENYAPHYDNVADLLKKKPDELKNLYFDTHKFLDDPEEITRLKQAGYDGAIHIGNGETATSVEHRVFDPSQVRSAFLKSDTKPGMAIAAAEHAPPFYSALEHAVTEHPQEVAPAKQWAATLANKPGVKPDELKYTGTSDMLAAKGDQPVTKAELQNHLEQNKVQLSEIEKRANPSWEDLPGDQQWHFADVRDMNPTQARERYEEMRAEGEGVGLPSESRYSGYQLPGGTNYREKLLTLPEKVDPLMARAKELGEAENGAGSWDRIGGGGQQHYIQDARREFGGRLPQYQDNFQSSHWDEPNVLAHLRMNDRVMQEPGYIVRNTKSGHGSQAFASEPEARAYVANLPESLQNSVRIVPEDRSLKALHLEEIQSDWHQQGRQNGYTDPAKMEDLKNQLEEQRRIIARNTDEPSVNAALARKRELNVQIAGMADAVPGAPFKKNWHELALKRALHEAAEGGYDRLSWTPGEAQASNPKVMAMTAGRAILPGMEEQVARADQGLRGFYNKIVPDYLNKVGKPHGAEVKMGATDTGGSMSGEKALHTLGLPKEHWDAIKNDSAARDELFAQAREKASQVPYIDITPSLRQHLLTKGMPLFEDNAAALPIAAAEHAPTTKGVANVERANPGGAGGPGAGDRGLEEAQRASARAAGAVSPLPGLPQKPITLNGESYVPGPIGRVHDVAKQYMESTGRPYERAEAYRPIDPEHSTAIARAFDEMKHDPQNPRVKASYEALAKETGDQYRAIKKSGLKVEPITPDMPDPYATNPRLAAKDVAENNHLWFFPTEQGFGAEKGAASAEHPMLHPSGETLGGKPLLNNDLFRIVHDYFGHLKEGNGFRAAGEDNAWRTHSKMYSDLAKPAMTTETRGQNSWVNYGPHGETNRTASAADTHYSEQKVGLMPDWTMRDRDAMGELQRAAGADPNTMPHPGAKYPQYAEQYPPVGPPQLIDKATNKPIATKGKAAQKLVDQGKAYWAKKNTPEAEAFQKDRAAIQKDMEAKGYDPFFPPEERAHVDPANHPTSLDMTKDALPAKQATIDKYHEMFATPEARKRLQKAFDAGKQIPGANDWYAMRQLEDQYVKHLGPEEGRQRFAREFAHTMAATTGGSDPTSNLLLAHYVQWASKNKGVIPEASHELPFPIGGRYVSGNIDQFRKMPEGGFTENNPKRHDFAHAFLGHPNKATMDEQMSGGLVPGMSIPPGDSYGVAAQVVHDLAAKNGVHPRDFQDQAWAGLKKMKTEEAGKKFSYKGPMITDVNDAIERTHRLTGTPRNEIVRRGLVKKEIPLYAGGVPMGSLNPQDDQ